MDDALLHNESFLQWLWETLRFDARRLKTQYQSEIQLLDPGRCNHSDGPDFSDARFVLDGLTWHGDIELHIRESDWYQHSHHTDPNYNNVVLHVFLKPGSPAKRADGTQPYRLNLMPHLPNRLQQLARTFATPNQLACQNLIPHLSPEVLEKQFRKAHREYFEQKVDDLLAFYPAGPPLDEAWREMLLTGFWDGLGIAHNRQAMQDLLRKLNLDYSGETRYDPESLRLLALKRSGLRGPQPAHHWKHKGVRPNNHPSLRIQQAAWITSHLIKESLRTFLSASPRAFWQTWLESAPPSLQIGQQRSEILFGTVFLPSLYLLGALGASTSLKQRSFDSWQQLRTPIPRSLLQPFRETSIPREVYHNRLGSVHQIRHYCRAHRCHQCEILKNSIGA
jgi:hypothetical protein